MYPMLLDLAEDNVNGSGDIGKLADNGSSPLSWPARIEEQENVVLLVPVVDLEASKEEPQKPSIPLVLATEMEEYELDIAATRYPNPLEMPLAEE